MKTIRFALILVLTILSFAPVAETKAQGVSVSVNFNTFQQELSPYGQWRNDARYGQVWIYNDANFKPYYSDGHWEYTNYGWSWISDYDWGWAPFHYGRWEEDPAYGWMWIPGYEWASAWVTWSSVDDYYGWAPLGYGVNINVSFGSIAQSRWNFIPRRNICDRDVYRYCEPYGRNNNFRNAVVINNYYNGNGGVGRYVRGPERREAERYTNNRIRERRVDYNDRSWNRGNNVRNRNDNNGNGRRNNDATANNNNGNWNRRRNNDVNNSNNNGAPSTGQANNRPPRDANSNPQTNDNNNGWGRRRNNDNSPGNNNDNTNPRRRDVNQNGSNNQTPPVVTQPQNNGSTNPGNNSNGNNRWNRRNDQQNNNQQPNVNTAPQANGSNTPGGRPNENRWNRRNEQQNTNQAPAQQAQRQPQYERPVQQPQQRQPQYERPAPQQQQQSAPAMEQRRMERRADNNGGQQGGNGGMQRGNGGRRNG